MGICCGSLAVTKNDKSSNKKVSEPISVKEKNQFMNAPFANHNAINNNNHIDNNPKDEIVIAPSYINPVHIDQSQSLLGSR